MGLRGSRRALRGSPSSGGGMGGQSGGGLHAVGRLCPPPPPSSPPHPTLCTPSAAMNRLKGTDFVSRTASPEGTEELLRELLVS